MSNQTTGRFSVDEIRAMAETDSAVFAIVSKTLTKEEISAVQTARNVLASARILDNVTKDLVPDFDKERAAAFIASLPDFAETFVSLFRSAVVKDGRGRGGAKNLRRTGHVSYSDDGTARVSAISLPVPNGSLRIVHETETTDAVTKADAK